MAFNLYLMTLFFTVEVFIFIGFIPTFFKGVFSLKGTRFPDRPEGKSFSFCAYR